MTKLVKLSYFLFKLDFIFLFNFTTLLIKQMNFTVYKSSAGSGKTFTLVKEYLSVVLKNPYEFKNILAITFTNKAAAEMKTRVLLSLELLSDFDSLNDSKKAKIIDLYYALLAKGLKHDEIIQNSKITLSNIIHNYNYFSIGTIDSFTHKIVKSFAFDLKLPLNFDVELEKLVLIKQAVEILISKIGTDNELTNFMLKFANSFIEDEKKADIKKQLIKLSELLFEEDSPKYLNELKNLNLNDFEKIIDEVKTNKKLIENTISNYANDCIDLIKSKNIDLNSFYQKNNGLGNYLLKLSMKNVILPKSHVISTLNNDLWYSKTTPQHEKQAIDSIKNLLRDKVRNLIDYLNENNKKYIIANAILGNIYSLSLLNEIEKIINQISHYDNVIHISEFSKSINNIVNNEPIPFIYERVGERYKNFLIDEFQDTSLLQWQNLLPLIENSLSENNFNMIVGDGKQAIYRFRGGEVEQFADLPEIYKKDEFNFAEERENSIKQNYKEENLKTNFRSKANIVKFNNLFFDFAAKNLKNDLIKKVYHNHSQEFKQTNTGGGVMIKFIDAENKNIYKQSTYKAVLQCIENQISDGYQLKDITVLCRDNDKAYHIANYLNANSIEVISSDSLLLISSAQVRLLVSLLKYINNKNDKINNANIIQLFLEIFRKDNTELNNFLIEYDKNPAFLDELFEIFNLKLDFQLISSLSLYELCENIIYQIFTNADTNPYLMFFLDTVYNFTTKYNTSTADFINFWEEKKSEFSLKVPSGINAVTVMTIHKSKGLEFPVVIYPFADSVSKNTKKNLWIKVDNIISEKLPYSLIQLNKKITETEYGGFYEEESQKSKLDLLNIIYVAFTRAAERLYIITSKVKESAKNSESTFTLPILIKNFVENENLVKIDENIYVFGEFTVKAETKKTDTNTEMQLAHSIQKEFNKSLNISKIAPDIWSAFNPGHSRTLGTIIHEILSKTDKEEEIDKILDYYIKDNKINKTEKENFSAIISKIKSNNEFRNIIGNKASDYKEAEIISPDGKTLRPDRIILSKDATYIIDYKTGTKNQYHKTQLESYKKILSEMGYSNIKLCLVYLKNEPEIEIWQ